MNSVVFGANQKPCEVYSNIADWDYQKYCENIDICEDMYSPKKDWLSILKIDQIPFLPIVSKQIIVNAKDNIKEMESEINESRERKEKYIKYLQKIWSGIIVNSDKSLDIAKDVYIETQNALFNCAIFEAKIRVIEVIINNLRNVNSSNQMAKFENQKNILNAEINKRKCNFTNNIKRTWIKQVLLKNMTYHYCNYRYYLNYLGNYADYNANSYSISSKSLKPWLDIMTTNNLNTHIIRQKNLIKNEISKARQTYNQSLITFREFENTYWVHIMLTFIFDDYIQIRQNMAKLLNPISQLIYKIPQAQKQ